MNHLTGIEYVTSPEKVELDMRFKAMVGPPASLAEGAIRESLAKHFEPGTDSLYYGERVGPGHTIYKMPKIRTMHDEGTGLTDADINFSKANPRIVSRGAHLVRDAGLDELPQLHLLPALSMVGPRSFPPDYLDYFLASGKQVDSGVAADWEEFYLCPDIRHGLTGPGQLRLAWHNERTPENIADSMRADLGYYPEKACEARDVAIVLATPFQLAGSALWKRLRAKQHTKGKHSTAFGSQNSS